LGPLSHLDRGQTLEHSNFAMTGKKEALGPKPASRYDMAQPGHEEQVLLLGSLQTGKSVLFERLSRPGGAATQIRLTSDRLARARLKPRLAQRFKGAFARVAPQRFIVDSPGTATLFPQGEDETVALEALLTLRPNILLLVADARNLRRSLALFYHAAAFGRPMVMALNMVDEAALQGIEVDAAGLESALGIPVVTTVASDGTGIFELLRRLDEARIPAPMSIPGLLEEPVAAVTQHLGGMDGRQQGLALALLAGNAVAEARVLRELGRPSYDRCRRVVEAMVAGLPRSVEVLCTEAFYERAEAVAGKVVRVTHAPVTTLERFSHVAQHPIWGLGVAALVLVLLYFFVGVLGATIVVDWFHDTLFHELLEPVSQRALAWIPSALVRDALLDPDFGLLPTGLFLAVGVVFPVLLFFYLAFAVLQDSGYLARLSVLLDRHMRRVGLNGRGLVPLAMGFSCVTMALITTRMLETRRERLIASFLMMLAVPCAPLLGVILVVLGDLPPSATVLVFSLIALQLLLAGSIANRLLPGRSGDFIMELPPMRIPRLRHVLWTTWRQTFLFMREAVPYFLLATFALFVFDRLGGLQLTKEALRPGFESLLALPEETVQVFIKTFVRRENGAAELERLKEHFTPLQLVVTILLMTFVAPCINSVLVLYKVRGTLAATAILLVITGYALVLGAVVNHGCHILGVTFAG
jgi:ferrous iron transport protein B